MRRWRLALALGAGISAFLLAGCSSASTATTSTTSTTASPATTTTIGPYYQVGTGTVHGLGTVLVNGKGMTLYLFVPDKQSGKSSCYQSCAQGWPPLLLPSGVTSPVAGAGAESSLLGTTTRSGGTTQVTYNKWPLYTWVGDTQPGQATGQGINNLGGLWYVLSPSGHEITAKP